jgi:hypothetical protein
MASGVEGSTIDDDLGDWDEVSTEPPPPQAAGLYRGRITEAKVTPTKEGLPGITVAITLKEPYEPGGTEVTMKRAVSTKLGVHKDAAFRVKQLSNSADVSPPKRNGHEFLLAYCEELLGKDVIVRTKLREYDRPDGSGKGKAVDIAAFETDATIEAAKAPKDGSGAEVTGRRRSAA